MLSISEIVAKTEKMLALHGKLGGEKQKKGIEKGAKKAYLVVAQTNKKEVKQCSKKKISQFS